VVGNTWDPRHYDRSCGFVWKHGEELIELLAPKPGERVLDIGSGTGHLTAEIARRGAQVLGIDSSLEMVKQARSQYPDLHFEIADASRFRTSEPFDAVFSNAALHWMTDAEGVVVSIAQSLKPGGRFVAEFGGKGNVRRLSEAAVAVYRELAEKPVPAHMGLWHFPGISEYAGLLERHGLEVHYANLFDRPTVLEGGSDGLRDWIEMFLKRVLQTLPPDATARFIERMEERLKPHIFRDGNWVMDYRRLRVAAVRLA